MRSLRASLLIASLACMVVVACVLNPQPDVPSDDGTQSSAGGSGGLPGGA